VKAAWIDLRGNDLDGRRSAILEAAIHVGCEAVLTSDAELLDSLPPTIMGVFDPGSGGSFDSATTTDVLETTSDVFELVPLSTEAEVVQRRGSKDVVGYVHVTDDASLKVACRAAQELAFTLVHFKDPTKIPLEIVIAAADRSDGKLICTAEDAEEARVIIDVLEKGAEGVCLRPNEPADVFDLIHSLQDSTADLKLGTFKVQKITHIGLGERVCIDTTTNFEKNEGMLIGSYAHGFILCVSETHPLPYMPTRPFRINAGALHSYVLGADNRTNYLSELGAGSVAMGVDTNGRTRRITVGRIKLESRPLLSIDAKAEDGTQINLIVQDDWHVRVLGPGDAVLNVTELKEGTEVLGYVVRDKRHVGWPVAEFCIEK